GVGVKPVPLSKLSARIFLKRLSQLLNDKRLYRNSKQMALKINSEKGIENAVELIETIIRKEKDKISA
ncbi:MAG: hypothetical protein WBP45_05315, partial [Daejeonella sp.]